MKRNQSAQHKDSRRIIFQASSRIILLHFVCWVNYLIEFHFSMCSWFGFFKIFMIENLLSYYLANKRSLHIRSQGLEIPTLIEQKEKIKITHHCHYDKNWSKIPLCLIKKYPPLPLLNN